MNERRMKADLLRVDAFRYRINHQMNQAEFSAKCGLSRPHYTLIENGVRIPSDKTMKKIRNAMED